MTTKEFILKVVLTCVVIAVLMPMCLSGCGENASEPSKPTVSRFVEVDEALICPDYKLGIDSYLSYGSTERDINDYRYLVDRVSRLVYIEIRETGQHSSGIDYLLCPDENGNHMVYTGELPE